MSTTTPADVTGPPTPEPDIDEASAAATLKATKEGDEDNEPDKKGLAKKLEKNNYEFRNFQREMRDTLTKLQESIAGIKRFGNEYPDTTVKSAIIVVFRDDEAVAAIKRQIDKQLVSIQRPLEHYHLLNHVHLEYQL